VNCMASIEEVAAAIDRALASEAPAKARSI
jgi:hypothetical protein